MDRHKHSLSLLRERFQMSDDGCGSLGIKAGRWFISKQDLGSRSKLNPNLFLSEGLRMRFQMQTYCDALRSFYPKTGVFITNKSILHPA